MSEYLLQTKHKESQLNILTKNEWNDLTELMGLNNQSLGVYLPENFTAYILNEGNEVKETAIHEYYGHGLFFENHPIGQIIHYLSQDLRSEEWRIFNTIVGNKQITLDYEEQGFIGLYYTLNVLYTHYREEMENIAEELTKKIMESDLNEQFNKNFRNI